MIISKDGYSIEYYPRRNQIVITMPQTLQTLTNTVSMVTNRKTHFNPSELSAILAVVRAIVEVEHESKT